MDMEKVLKEFEEEKARIDAQMQETMKSLNISDAEMQKHLESVNELPQELKDALEKIKTEAERAGAERAEQARQNLKGHKAAPSRRGAMRI